jgi:hypothetical protein
VTLVVGKAFFINDSSQLLDCVLMLDIHWHKKESGEGFCFVEGEGEAITVFYVFLDELV